MPDLSHYDRLREAFDSLLHELAVTWPANDIEYVRDEVGYGEYGDALENLIALGLRSGFGFSPEQAQQVEAMAAAMEMTDSSLLQLREPGGEASAKADSVGPRLRRVGAATTVQQQRRPKLPAP